MSDPDGALLDLTSMGDLLAFGTSHFGRTVVWVAADIYALYALSRVAGLGETAAGAVFLAIMLFSATCDLAVGWVCDRYRPPRSHTLIIASICSAIALAISLTSRWSLLAVAAAFVFRLAYAVYDVPHNALIKRLGAPDGGAAVTLSAVRFLTGAAASFAVAGLAGRVVAPGGQGLGWLAIFSAIVAGVAMVAYAPALARLRPPPAPPRSVERRRTAAITLALIGVALLGATLGGLVTQSLAFINDTGLGGLGWTGRALAILTVGRFIAAPVWAWAGRHVPLVTLTAIAFGAVGLGGGSLVVESSSTRSVETGLLVLGAGFSGVTVNCWALLPDLSNALGRSLKRDPIHMAVAVYTAINKLALGVSGAAMAALLSWTGSAQDGVPLSRAVGLVILVGGVACAVILILAGKRLRRLAPAKQEIA